MRNWIWMAAAVFLLPGILLAQKGYQIRVKLDGFTEKELYLAYYYGKAQYIKDTTQITEDGYFIFQDEEPLPPGIYLVVLPPDNKYFQLLINEGEQSFTVNTQAEDPTTPFKVKGSPENELFYSYLNYLAKKRPLADEIRAKIDAAGADAAAKEKLEKELEALDEDVLTYQKDIAARYPNSFTAKIIQANLPMDIPEFEGADQMEIETKKWRYSQKHFFDNLNMDDPGMLRTPFLFQRVDYFVNKLQVQHPDTLSRAIDLVLEKVRPAPETFKYFLIHFLNTYAQSNLVGMDAVYVHLAENYYAAGQATWTEEEQLKKIVENARTLKPLLIGKIAPNVVLEKKDGSKIALHDVQAKYTVLYFWKYDCGHCQKSMPLMQEFYQKFKDKGVELMAVCVKFGEDVPECWKFIEENGVGNWLHAVDPYHRSRFGQIYNVQSTPQLYILDEKKEILSKRIGAEQLEEVMTRLMEMREQKEESGKR